MTYHLCHFINGVCTGPASQPGPCGERQTFRPPAGQSEPFPTVLVDRTDLQALLVLVEVYRDRFPHLPPEIDLLLNRTRDLL